MAQYYEAVGRLKESTARVRLMDGSGTFTVNDKEAPVYFPRIGDLQDILRAFNAVGSARMASVHHEPGRIGMPIAGDDAQAIEVASELIRDIGFEPVLIGGLEKGKYLMPGTPLAGEHSPEEIRRIAAGLL